MQNGQCWTLFCLLSTDALQLWLANHLCDGSSIFSHLFMAFGKSFNPQFLICTLYNPLSLFWLQDLQGRDCTEQKMQGEWLKFSGTDLSYCH